MSTQQFKVIYHDLDNRTKYYDTQQEAYQDIKQVTIIANQKYVAPKITIYVWNGQVYVEHINAVPRPLTAEESEQRKNLPSAYPQKFVNKCSVCQSPIKWVDPAKIALVDKHLWLQQKQVIPIQRLLKGYAWVCLNCTHTEILL